MTQKPRKRAAKKLAVNDESLFELYPRRDAKPLVSFMCFDTPNPDVFLRCEWNADQQRFNKDCRQVERAECQGGA